MLRKANINMYKVNIYKHLKTYFKFSYQSILLKYRGNQNYKKSKLYRFLRRGLKTT
jgi:hypothetical protein